jgi:hypothetical protein
MGAILLIDYSNIVIEHSGVMEAILLFDYIGNINRCIVVKEATRLIHYYHNISAHIVVMEARRLIAYPFAYRILMFHIGVMEAILLIRFDSTPSACNYLKEATWLIDYYCKLILYSLVMMEAIPLIDFAQNLNNRIVRVILDSIQ